jgi:hypothetical protein
MDTSTFYATASALCFTLLGFWWVVVEYKHDELTTSPGSRHFTFLVSLHFILPGIVSLASLLATGALWRVAFGLAGLTGMLAVIVGMRDIEALPGPVRGLGRAAWLGVPLYGLLTVVAIFPDLARSLLSLEPLQVEGFILLVVLLLGILLAWILFTGPLSDDEETTKGPG